MTITKILCGCAVFAFAVQTASAQTKHSLSGTCAKPDIEQSVPAGDLPGHTFMIAQGKCTATDEIAGALSKEAAYSEHRDVSGNRVKAWGVYVATYASGDKIFYSYQSSLDMKDGAVKSGKNTYHATSGTGKMKGIKETGTCTYGAGTDGGNSFSCTGDYTLVGVAPTAK
jgi:hypothetical protein